MNPAVNANPTAATSERERLAADPNQPAEVTLWHKAAGDPPLPHAEYADAQGVIRSESRDGNYVEYYNCLPDAFKTARERLEQHRQQFGADNAAVLSWLEAQRKVFANCGQPYQFNKPPLEAVIPAAAAESDPPVIRADRQYQIAAAYFYAGDFNAAAARFEEISKTKDSPWRELGAYLQARALIRRGTLGDAKGNFDKAALIAAERILQQIVADPAQAKIKPAAQRRLDFLAARLHPEERRVALANWVMHPGARADFDQHQADYFWLLDRQGYTLEAKDDLTNWISAMKLKSPQATDEAIEQWQKTKSVPWLVAALCKTEPTRPEVPALLKAAESVDANSPAHATLLFHSLRLRAKLAKDPATVAADIDRVIAGELKSMPVSAQNQFLALRMSLARSFDEFSLFAFRTPAGVTYNFGDVSDSGMRDKLPAKDGKPPEAQLDADAAIIFSEKIPLSLLAAASKKESLPLGIQRRLTLAAWTRAVLLKNDSISQELAARVVALAPELKPALESYASSQSIDDRNFAAVFAILRSPGFRPFVETGFGRETPTEQLDNLHDNWWCALQPAVPGAQPAAGSYSRYPWRTLSSALKEIYTDGDISAARFLSAEDSKVAAAELEQLGQLPAGPEWLGAEAITFAKTHPDDPRVPEALHLTVRATRYGCTGDGAGQISKSAFDLLHKKYPDSPWAKKTPYWFK
ncbi:MAG TPA: hypothetical protein VKT53_07840 [Candidatus Acidoferrum sp.]|nr:hypothetical protein [Candidatus Acidoferrum sp.]